MTNNNNNNNNNPFLTFSVYVLRAIIRDCEARIASRRGDENISRQLDLAIRALWAAEKEGRTY